jgi:dienelactone hydrolase
MIEKQVDVKTPDGVADCDFFYPDDKGAWPAIIMYTDIGGRRAVFREMAKKLAAEGYAVLVPNPFYRVGRAPLYENFTFGEEKTTARMNELRPSVTPSGVAKDGAAYVDFLLKQKSVTGKHGDAHGRRGARQCRSLRLVPRESARHRFPGVPAHIGAQDQGADVFRLCHRRSHHAT